MTRIAPAPTEAEGKLTRILVVDDSAFQRRILTQSLRRRGYDVTEAASGAEALNLIDIRPFEILLSDWMMPGMSGLALCKTLRKRASGPYLYVILLTSKQEKDEIARGLDAGADDFIVKPVDGTELDARIRAGQRLQRMERDLHEKNRQISAALDELTRLYDGVARDLQHAKALQMSLVGQADQVFGPAHVHLMLRACGPVGGDLVGCFRINDTQLGLFGLDVCGHGISSALMTARLAGLLQGNDPGRNLALKTDRSGMVVAEDPAKVASLLNTLLLEEMETEHYFTMVLCSLDLLTGKLRGVQAGHPHPVLRRRKTGHLEGLGSGGLPIGLIPNAEFEAFETRLAPGDRLVLPSDGLTEAANAAGQMWETSGLMRAVSQSAHVSTAQVMEQIVSDLSRWAERDEFDDDLSALVVDFLPAPDQGLQRPAM